MKEFLVCLLTLTLWSGASAREWHVSVNGDDAHDGSQERPFRSIQHAAELAQPGDTITVYAGTYRERINPPRGGLSDEQRIVYQAAPGEKVMIKGSEVVTGWERVQNDTWKVVLPNSFFGDYNPYSDLISGDWFEPWDREHHTGTVYLNGHWLREAPSLDAALEPASDSKDSTFWYGQVDETHTTLWAQFKDVDPNQELVEITAREAVFYPEKPFINYITVRGFHLWHAGPQWAPPTAEQVGLIGTHWSKGWIIEDNDIRYSICTGLTLGKYSDEYDNKSESAPGYVETIRRALEMKWKKEHIGSHIVRNNTIAYCEQAGMVGSMGAAYSTITGNTIHDINYRKIFGGAEMAGIKFHGPIDTVISGNHIYRTERAIWLDWMTQGTRVSGNLLHDSLAMDLFVEVNHGPFLVDNNIMLSRVSILTQSQGGAYVHNLFAGEVKLRAKDGRRTPYHQAHSTEIAGLHLSPLGDDRYYNNIFVNSRGMEGYDDVEWPVYLGGNVLLGDTTFTTREEDPLVDKAFESKFRRLEKQGDIYLEGHLDASWAEQKKRTLVTTERLGKAKIPDLPYVNPDGSSIRVDTDYFGNPRKPENPFPGPFASPRAMESSIKVWPIEIGAAPCCS